MERVDVAIIGAGFSGLGTAIRLKQEGVEDFVVLERDEEVGGTWWANTYPGCGCDIPSHLYSYSFELNPDWSRTYSRQPEIRDYLSRCADKYGVRPHIRLRTNVTSAEWDDDERRWRLETSAGPMSARVLIAGAGPLAEPKFPDVPGLDSFEGKVMHSARWDHTYDLRGKRVASVGTGASAIQYVPMIQPEVEKLHVFQRTAPWIFPHTDRPTTKLERRLYKRLPALQKLMRGLVYAGREWNSLLFLNNRMKVAELIAKRHMKRQVKDPELREKVTPDYTIGCKRILPSDRWYPALQQPNVELETEGIAEVKPRSLVTRDGREIEVDAIILGTGFHVSDMPVAKYVRGRGGKSLDELWEHSPRAHMGTTVAGAPNLFLLLGPNTGLGHNSIVYMAESQFEYILDALRTMRARGADAVEVRHDAMESFNRELDSMLEGTVWSTGCRSWYLDESGRNAAIWPDWTFNFRRRVARFDEESYEFVPARAPEPVPLAA